MGSAASLASGAELSDAAALAAATETIQKIIYENGSITTEAAGELLDKYMTISAKAKQHFPGAGPGSWILKNAVRVLKDYAINGENTLYSQSLCPDEINHEVGDISTLLSGYLGEVFHLGGLAGVPFTGRTGFGSFAHHVPDNGNLFVLQAPHIGISSSGELGKYSLDGQSHDGHACGATVGAFKQTCTDAPIPTAEDLGTDGSDYQMQYLISELNKRKDAILAKEGDADALQAELCMQTYAIGKDMLDKIVSADVLPKGYLVTLTGVQINMPRPFEDFFCPLTFELQKKDQMAIDLMPKAFGWGAQN
eukprot:GSChrysophyteH2.ASY1.ANO1.182.1 assembled CDS